MGVLNNDLHDLDVRLGSTRSMVICSAYAAILDAFWLFGTWPEWCIRARHPNGDENLSTTARFTKYAKMIEQWLTEQVKMLPIESTYNAIVEFANKLFTNPMVEHHKLGAGDCYFININDQRVISITIIYMGR